MQASPVRRSVPLSDVKDWIWGGKRRPWSKLEVGILERYDKELQQLRIPNLTRETRGAKISRLKRNLEHAFKFLVAWSEDHGNGDVAEAIVQVCESSSGLPDPWHKRLVESKKWFRSKYAARHFIGVFRLLRWWFLEKQR